MDSSFFILGMAYQVPKKTHPWRQYKDRKDESEAAKPAPSLKAFIFAMAESWDSYTIPSGDLGDGYAKIATMNDAKAAAWLAKFLKKTWITRGEVTVDDF